MMQVTSTDLALYEHEDSAVQVHFCDDDLDRLEQYDLEFYDDELFTTELRIRKKHKGFIFFNFF